MSNHAHTSQTATQAMTQAILVGDLEGPSKVFAYLPQEA